MKVKYNRVSTILQTGNRFEADTDRYDITLLDKVSGSVSFRDRVEAKKLVKLVEDGKVTELVVEEFSRLGRNTGDVISTLDWLDQYKVNVRIRNLGVESRPNGKRNPVWKILSATMSSLYEMELENIIETPILMEITGHSRESTFLSYIGENPNKDAVADVFMERLRRLGNESG